MRVEALPDTVVVDASVGLKWVIDELGSDAAVALVAGRALVTSALFWVEAANVLATKERRGELDRVSGWRTPGVISPGRRWRRCRWGWERRNAPWTWPASSGTRSTTAATWSWRWRAARWW